MDPMEPMREFKVHVPLFIHLHLHRHRLLTGTSLSGAVSVALDRYLEKHLGPDVA